MMCVARGQIRLCPGATGSSGQLFHALVAVHFPGGMDLGGVGNGRAGADDDRLLRAGVGNRQVGRGIGLAWGRALTQALLSTRDAGWAAVAGGATSSSDNRATGRRPPPVQNLFNSLLRSGTSCPVRASHNYTTLREVVPADWGRRRLVQFRAICGSTRGSDASTACKFAASFCQPGVRAGRRRHALTPASPFGVSPPARNSCRSREAYQVDIEAREDHSLRVWWQIADAYYLYRHRFTFKLTDEQGEVPLAVELPAGLQREDEYFGEVEVTTTTPTSSWHRRSDPRSASSPWPWARRAAPTPACAIRRRYSISRWTSAPAASARASCPGRAAVGPANDPVRGYRRRYVVVHAVAGLPRGAILNLMPLRGSCILSLKVLSFAPPQLGSTTATCTAGCTAPRVIASFVLVAALSSSCNRPAGPLAGFPVAVARLRDRPWPTFRRHGPVLSGLVEFGGSLMNTGSGLANRGGLSGSFFTGVLAVVVASPCTALFMGTARFCPGPAAPGCAAGLVALGAGMRRCCCCWAIARRGAGCPNLGRGWTPKQLLAFPLYATAIWLLVGRPTNRGSIPWQPR